MIDTFLDSSIHYSRSFVICGKLDEVFCGNDLKISGFEAYLVELLKSRDYSTIVFFEPRRGAYCLDEESARNFFYENKGLPESRIFDPEQPEDSGLLNTSSATNEAQQASIWSIRDQEKKQYGGSPAASETSDKSDRAAERKLIVAKKAQDINNFVEQVNSELMHDGNKFAAIFSNINTTDISLSVLRDLVSHGADNSDGLILFLARESFFSNDTLRQLADLYGSRFVFREENHYDLNPRTCIRIGVPEKDEIINLLRRYSIRGTGRIEKGRRKGHIIDFDETELDEIASRILRYSRDN